MSLHLLFDFDILSIKSFPNPIGIIKSGKTKSDTYQKRKAIFGAKTKSDENNKGDTWNSYYYIDDGLHVQIKLYILFPCQ